MLHPLAKSLPVHTEVGLAPMGDALKGDRRGQIHLARCQGVTGSADVEAWFEKKGHPQEALMRKVRQAILASDKRVAECIKWSCPTFTYEGNIVSINPQAKKFVSLLFHQGAKIPGRFPSLEGGGDTARYMQVQDEADLKAKKGELAKIVRAWCDMKGGP